MSVLVLPARLDLPAAAPLREQLLALRGSPVSLAAQEVTALGGLCLQVLIAAARSWASDGQGFTLENPSVELRQALEVFGVAESDLGAGGPA